MTKLLQSLPQVELPLGEKVASVQNGIPSETPEPIEKFSSPREKKIWLYITSALRDYGLIHRTDVVQIHIICRIFDDLLEAEKQLAKFKKTNNGNFMVTTPNGYEQPHQLFYVVRDCRKQLLQWLPEAALTIPSFSKAVENRNVPIQGSLFEDPVEKHRKEKPMPMRAV